MAENVDVQLKRMTQDLREIIEHINCSNINTREAEDPVRLFKYMYYFLWFIRDFKYYNLVQSV